MIYGRRYNLFDLKQKFIWFEQIFIWFKDTWFESNKFYSIQINNFFKSKKFFQTNNFLWFNFISFWGYSYLTLFNLPFSIRVYSYPIHVYPFTLYKTRLCFMFLNFRTDNIHIIYYYNTTILYLYYCILLLSGH